MQFDVNSEPIGIESARQIVLFNEKPPEKPVVGSKSTVFCGVDFVVQRVLGRLGVVFFRLLSQ